MHALLLYQIVKHSTALTEVLRSRQPHVADVPVLARGVKPWNMRFVHRSVLVFILIVCIANFCHGKITKASVKNDDRSLILLSKPFGFSTTGHISVVLSNVKVRWPELASTNYSDFGVYILSSDEDGFTLLPRGIVIAALCFPLENQSQSVERLFDFQDTLSDASTKPTGTRLNFTTARDWDRSGLYAILFANCVEDAVVSFNVRIQLSNIDSDGETNYLSVGEQELPTMYLVRHSARC